MYPHTKNLETSRGPTEIGMSEYPARFIAQVRIQTFILVDQKIVCCIRSTYTSLVMLCSLGEVCGCTDCIFSNMRQGPNICVLYLPWEKEKDLIYSTNIFPLHSSYTETFCWTRSSPTQTRNGGRVRQCIEREGGMQAGWQVSESVTVDYILGFDTPPANRVL